MGQMSNGEDGSEEEDTSEFESELDDIMSEMEGEDRKMAVGGDVMPMEQTTPAAQQTPEAIPTKEAPTVTPEQMSKIQETAKNMQRQQAALSDIPPSNPTEGLKPSDIVRSNFTPERQKDADTFLAKIDKLARAKRVIMTRHNDTVVVGFVKREGVLDPYLFSNDSPEKMNEAISASIQIAKKAGIRTLESDSKGNIQMLTDLGYPVQETEKGWSLDIQ